LILQFLCHAEFISASLRLKEVLKQVQDGKVIFAFFIIALYECFSLKESYFLFALSEFFY